MIELVYETHSITTDNEQGIATGWLPGELFELGRELARELGRRRRHSRFAFALAAPAVSPRSHESAAPSQHLYLGSASVREKR